MLSCSIWFSAPSFWMGGGLESHCVGRVYGANGDVLGSNQQQLEVCTLPFFYIALNNTPAIHRHANLLPPKRYSTHLSTLIYITATTHT